jgi:hypothetical protein
LKIYNKTIINKLQNTYKIYGTPKDNIKKKEKYNKYMVYLKIMAERNGGDFELPWMFEFLILFFLASQIHHRYPKVELDPKFYSKGKN